MGIDFYQSGRAERITILELRLNNSMPHTESKYWWTFFVLGCLAFVFGAWNKRPAFNTF